MELDWGRRIHPSLPIPKPTPAARVDYPIQPEFKLAPLERRFAETTERPVFSPFRRPPPPPPPPAPPKPTMQKGQFVLLGALITKEKSIALLRDVATGKATRVELGKEIKGITLTKIYPDKVVLTQFDDTEELVLKIQPMTKPAPAPAPIPSPGPFGQPAQAGQPPRPGPPQAAPPPSANVPASVLGRSLINERRAAVGMPPI